ncbi:MAG: Phenylalanine--tRNA ligase alpha subunit [Nitrospirae bacterium]|nr:MAG: phenylalanyl-tRNA synthetase subunit alpha [Nitrospira sp. OLB3]MBV6469988.1 Phenylalanine--tRNA ligase alpha subunit [Nitrospirota bacterium]MCE7964605.1 phenylalanine--tRNA ligase subunit alpha [Nitrospira sp. NTP2]MCK6493797.1 phenylalanine--tRNA ligase subunit alpha [Nitrospira sp.]MEB2338299.1 phenylalanine--tRNA ligase subunit alpha [Nitrospirales bacterium]
MDNLHPLESKVLLAMLPQQDRPATLDHLVPATGLEPSQLSMAIEWLLAKSLIAVHSETVASIASLTPTGEVYFDKYAPIERVLSTAKEAGRTGKRLTIQDIQAQEGLEASEVSKAVGTLKKEGAILIVQGGCIESTGRNSTTAESMRALLQELRGGARELQSVAEPLRSVLQQHAVKRGNTREPFRIDDRVTRTFLLTPAGQEVAQRLSQVGVAEEVSQLTPELLKDGTWRTKRFRKYTISLRAPRIAAGKRHPYREFLDLVKLKLVSMGFQEMRGTLVETEFWNMDALFMPQFHPARDIHDVYFVKEPTHARSIAEPYLTRVVQAHEKGTGAGSTGWGYQFDVERAKRLVLRSQGTAVSARALAGGASVPGKYFSIARCFRYDQVDATHATDFFQVEGIVLGADINFRTLLGLLNLFAREVAQAKEVKFLPAYFPFTEPSVEMHVRHPKLGWMELGGAGLFRPEVTTPLGVSVPVIAWGLGLDRMAMVALGIHDIRDLFSADLDFVRTMRGNF